MLFRDVMPSRAHIVSHGSKWESFHSVANVLHSNIDLTVFLDKKSIRKRYESMQDVFHIDQKCHAVPSRVGSELSQRNELLSLVWEARKE